MGTVSAQDQIPTPKLPVSIVSSRPVILMYGLLTSYEYALQYSYALFSLFLSSYIWYSHLYNLDNIHTQFGMGKVILRCSTSSSLSGFTAILTEP